MQRESRFVNMYLTKKVSSEAFGAEINAREDVKSYL